MKECSSFILFIPQQICQRLQFIYLRPTQHTLKKKKNFVYSFNIVEHLHSYYHHP